MSNPVGNGDFEDKRPRHDTAIEQELGGSQGRSGRVRKISPPHPPGFDPHTLQPVPSRRIIYAVQPTDTTHLCPKSKLRMGGAVSPLFCMPSCTDQLLKAKSSFRMPVCVRQCMQVLRRWLTELAVSDGRQL